MPYDTMSHLGLEAPIDISLLPALANRWHYGLTVWSGPEPTCDCVQAPCGLIVTVEQSCPVAEHDVRQLGFAKQLHKATECPVAA